VALVRVQIVLVVMVVVGMVMPLDNQQTLMWMEFLQEVVVAVGHKTILLVEWPEQAMVALARSFFVIQKHRTLMAFMFLQTQAN
jgi:hypothetical protein